MSGPVLEGDIAQWGGVYGNGRMMMSIGSGLTRRSGRRSYNGFDERGPTFIDLGDSPEAGVITGLHGRPLEASARSREIMDAVARGDYTWAEKTPRATRVDFSVSLFVPPDVTVEQLVEITAARVWPDATNGEINKWYGSDRQGFVLRPLAPELFPDPGSPQRQRLDRDAERWGGLQSWELVGPWPADLGRALHRIADVTDLAIFTVADRYRTRDDIIAFELAYGESWAVDYAALQHEIFIGPKLPPPKPPKVPDIHVAWPLRFFRVTYSDGEYFILSGHNHTLDGDRYVFTATLTNGDQFTTGWATAGGVVTVEEDTERERVIGPTNDDE